MIRQSSRFQFVAVIVLMLFTPGLYAQNVNSYILHSPSLAQAQGVCHRYGCQIASTIRQPDTYLVQLSAAVPPGILQQWVKNDPDVLNLELDNKAKVPEVSMSNTPYLPSMPVTTYVTDASLIRLYGRTAWVGYVQQPARSLTNVAIVQQQQNTGTGVVAIIDTGVDPNNPILAPVLVRGYDFTRNIAGYASDLAEINQSTAAILEQSTAAILEQRQVVQLNQSTAAILEQSTAAILKGQQMPAYFGHGTMVAGLVHLIAPSAKIMPLKAFNADGSSSTSNIVRAIYYATDNGANVINMSFSLSVISDEVMRAINYATRKGVVCVASVGNDGDTALVYPAAFGNVIGVASTSQQDQRSSFSNYGPDLVTVAAPGEALITTYPGAHYAAVWGTSFSSALVAGGADLLLAVASKNSATQVQPADVKRALAQAVACDPSGNLGSGCVDLNAAAQYMKQMHLPPPSH